MSWKLAIQGFSSYLRAERGFSAHTSRAYIADVSQLAEYVGEDVAPEEVDPDQVRAWLASIHAERSPATLGRRLSGARAFFRFLQRDDLLSLDPTAGIPAPKLPQRTPRPLSVDDCFSLADPPPSRRRGSPSSRDSCWPA